MNNKRRHQKQDTSWYTLVLSSLAVTSGITSFWIISSEPIQIEAKKSRKALSHPLKHQISYAIGEAFTKNLTPQVCRKLSDSLEGFKLDRNLSLYDAGTYLIKAPLTESADEIVQSCIQDTKKPGSKAIAGCFWVVADNEGPEKKENSQNADIKTMHLLELKLQFRDYRLRAPVSCESIFNTPSEALGVVAYYSIYWTKNEAMPLAQKVTGGFQIDLPRFMIEQAVDPDKNI